MGCDEYHAGTVTGPLTVNLLAAYTNVTVGYPIALTALIEGRATDSVWAFGDGDVAINQPYITHSWMQAGNYLVALWAFNESQAGGVSATLTIHVVAHPEYYVAAINPHPQPPYTSWSAAATNIQDAVNAAAQGTGLVLVTNGVYAGGMSVTKPLTLLSVNGPQYTVIKCGANQQCISLTNGASLTGFTLTNGSANYGGGVSCTGTNAFLTNCTLSGNGAMNGGGAAWCTLYNCTLSGNLASGGGGAAFSTLYNCMLTSNSVWGLGSYGGGANYCTLYNCTLSGNSARDGYSGS